MHLSNSKNVVDKMVLFSHFRTQAVLSSSPCILSIRIIISKSVLVFIRKDVEQERSIIRILNALTTFSLDNFDDRLRLQKIVFLARMIGFNLGYSFDWYARGPYSPSLTKMLFSANEEGRLILESVTLQDSEEPIVQQLSEFLGEDVSDPRILELLASVWYFIRRASYSKGERNDLVGKIIRRKPKYSREEVETAFDRITRFRY